MTSTTLRVAIEPRPCCRCTIHGGGVWREQRVPGREPAGGSRRLDPRLFSFFPPVREVLRSSAATPPPTSGCWGADQLVSGIACRFCQNLTTAALARWAAPPSAKAARRNAVVPPDPRCCFPRFHLPRFPLPVVSRGTKMLSGKSIRFKLSTILSRVMISRALPLNPAWDMTHALVQRLHPAVAPPALCHLVAACVTRSTVAVSWCWCSGLPCFTQ